jgi:hypothetical protein
MTTQQTDFVEQEIRVAASPEAIFPFFIELFLWDSSRPT